MTDRLGRNRPLVYEGTGIDQWEAAITDEFLPLQAKASGATSAKWSIAARRAADLWITDAGIDHPLRVETRRSSSATESVAVAYEHGSSALFEQDSVVEKLRPGDLVIYDCRRPFAFEWAQAPQTRVLMLPRSLLSTPDSLLRNTPARRITATDRRTGLFVPLLDTLHEGGLTDDVTAHVIGTVVSLIEAMLADGAGPTADALPHQQTVELITTFVEKHLSDPDLSIDDIAAAVHLSKRHLHRVFDQERLTLAGWIRERRLQRIAHVLISRPNDTTTIAEIAAAHGLPNPSHFTAMFRARFGIPPGEYRRLYIPQNASSGYSIPAISEETNMNDDHQELLWGVKPSLLAYIEHLPDGRVECIGDVHKLDDGTYRFILRPVGTDEFHCAGTLRLSGHEGALDIELREPVLRIDGDHGVMKVLHDGRHIPLLDLRATHQEEAIDGQRTFFASLTTEGMDFFVHSYLRGEEFAPVRVRTSSST